MTTLQSEHAKQLSAWHAANAENNNDDDNKEEKASNENSNVAAAPAVIPGQQQQQGLSKAAKRRLAKERAEEEHNARVADAAANRCGEIISSRHCLDAYVYGITVLTLQRLNGISCQRRWRRCVCVLSMLLPMAIVRDSRDSHSFLND